MNQRPVGMTVVPGPEDPVDGQALLQKASRMSGSLGGATKPPLARRFSLSIMPVKE